MKKEKILWFEAAFFIVNVLIVAFFYKNIPLTFFLLLIVAIIGLIHWKSMRTLWIFIGAGILGTVGEMVLIYAGVWGYTITTFFNVPLWLFVLWGNAASFIYQIARKVKEKKMKLK